MNRRRRTLAALAALGLAVGVSACSSAATAGGSGDGKGNGNGDGRIRVVSGFYPLTYLVESIGGDRVSVTTLTRPGVDPHDVELTPRDVGRVVTARLALHARDVQPAVDDAIAAQNPAAGYDVLTAPGLSLLALAEGGHDHGHAGHTDADTDAADDEHADEHAEEHAASESPDPHVWLDPTQYALVAKGITARLAAIDPAGAAAYRSNLATITGRLTALDADYRTTLATCTSRTLVTGHSAFGYLARRYDFEQVGVSLSPDAEPEPALIAEVADFVREHRVTTVYTETLASADVAETVARESGAATAVLDPIEGVTDASAGTDYLSIMRANLATLAKGQGCS